MEAVVSKHETFGVRVHERFNARVDDMIQQQKRYEYAQEQLRNTADSLDNIMQFGFLLAFLGVPLMFLDGFIGAFVLFLGNGFWVAAVICRYKVNKSANLERSLVQYMQSEIEETCRHRKKILM